MKAMHTATATDYDITETVWMNMDLYAATVEALFLGSSSVCLVCSAVSTLPSEIYFFCQNNDGSQDGLPPNENNSYKKKVYIINNVSSVMSFYPTSSSHANIIRCTSTFMLTNK